MWTQCSWVLWFDAGQYAHKNQKKEMSWEDSLQKIYTIETVEDFWAVINNIVNAQDIPPGSNYYMFKKGIKPAWEDTRNKEGGKWQVITNKSHRGLLNKMWEGTVRKKKITAHPTTQREREREPLGTWHHALAPLSPRFIPTSAPTRGWCVSICVWW